MLQWLVVGATKLLQRSPLVWRKLAHEDLARVALPTQVNLLCIDLVGNVDEEHVEEIVGDVVWLENDLNFVGVVGWNRSLLWNKHEGHLFAVVVNAVNEAFQIEVDGEGGHVLDLERLLCRLTDKNVAEGHDTVFGGDFHLWPYASTL